MDSYADRTERVKAKPIGSATGTASRMTVPWCPEPARWLQPFEGGDALAMEGGLAEEQLTRHGALEPQLEVEFPREADASVHLDGAARGATVHVTQPGLG